MGGSTRSERTFARLRAMPLFAGVDEASLRPLARALRERTLERGEILYRRNQAGDSMVILLEGCLAVRMRKRDGRPVAVHRVRPGEWVGEMGCVDPAPRSATVLATRRSVVLELSRPVLLTLSRHAPDLAGLLLGAIIEQVSGRLRRTDDRLCGAVRRRSVLDRFASEEADRAGRPLPGRPRAGPVDLRRIPGFREMPPRAVDELLSVARPRVVPDRTVLCREGEPGDVAFFIVKGEVDVSRRVKRRPRHLARLKEGALVGQLALVDDAPRSATVRARGEVVVLALRRPAFERLVRSGSPLAAHLQQRIAIAGIRQVRLANRRLRSALHRESPRKPASRERASAAPTQAPPGAGRAASPPAESPPRRSKPPRKADARSSPQAFLRAVLNESDVTLDDIAEVELGPADELPSASELRARSRR